MATDHPTLSAHGDDARLINICAELEAEALAWQQHAAATPMHLDVPARPEEAERTARVIALRQAIADTPARTLVGAAAKAHALLADAPSLDMMDDRTAAALHSLARDVAGLQARQEG